MRRVFWPLAAAAALLAAPGMAQNEKVSEPNEVDPFAAIAAAFPAEPLTAEQAARLPQAQALVEKIIPPGSMQDVMGTMFDSFIGPLSAATAAPTDDDAAELLGLDRGDLVLEEGHAAQIVAILDPAHEERKKRTTAAMPQAMNRMMAAAEPLMRQAMAEAYAIYFDTRELTDIGAFFDTPSGTAYARKSMSMASDPRFLGAMMRSMPDMTTGVGEMEATLAAAVADLPAAKGYADLTSAERKQLAELTGIDESTIELLMDTSVLEDDVTSEEE